jgi:hypothetical protein
MSRYFTGLRRFYTSRRQPSKAKIAYERISRDGFWKYNQEVLAVMADW